MKIEASVRGNSAVIGRRATERGRRIVEGGRVATSAVRN